MFPTFTYAATRSIPSENACSESSRAIVVATPRAASVRQHEVADLDDQALAVEVMERPAADDLAAAGINGREGQEPAFRQASAAPEARRPARRDRTREVAGLAQLGVAKRRHDPVDIREAGSAVSPRPRGSPPAVPTGVRHLHALDHTEALWRPSVLGSSSVAGVVALGTFAPSRSAAFLERMRA